MTNTDIRTLFSLEHFLRILYNRDGKEIFLVTKTHLNITDMNKLGSLPSAIEQSNFEANRCHLAILQYSLRV